MVSTRYQFMNVYHIILRDRGWTIFFWQSSAKLINTMQALKYPLVYKIGEIR